MGPNGAPAFDFDAPGRQDTAQSQKITKKQIFWKIDFFKKRWKMNLNLSPGAVFHAEFVSGSKIGPKPTQNPILTNFL